MKGRTSQGFTLIEMVIAFAILGLSLSVLYGAFESSLSRMRHDSRFSEATLLAKSLLARAGTEVAPGQGPLSGTWNEFAYTVTQVSSASPLASAQTVEATAEVSWVEISGKRSVSLATVKLLPRRDL